VRPTVAAMLVGIGAIATPYENATARAFEADRPP
jgi:hypothetical protein